MASPLAPRNVIDAYVDRLLLSAPDPTAEQMVEIAAILGPHLPPSRTQNARHASSRRVRRLPRPASSTDRRAA